MSEFTRPPELPFAVPNREHPSKPNLLRTALLGLGLLLGATPTSVPGAPLGEDAATPATPSALAANPATASGPVEVVVRLTDLPLARAAGDNAKQRGSSLNQGQRQAYLAKLEKAQRNVLARIEALGGVKLATTRLALNAVVVRVDASKLPTLAGWAEVASVRPVGQYQLDLTETVPFIGATAVQNQGFDGTGVRVAVLDSGIDYTHYNLGGSGLVADFSGNNPTIIEPSTFPTAKVIGGYDFVGESWPSGPRTEDPDPLDKGVGAGHGTHVADIIGGRSADGAHKGVAPGVSLYAVKVCSSTSTSCNGIALLLGMEYSLDPNGDGNPADAVDVINLSLGSSYGQREDDLSEACANAVRFGVTVVASAGNSADRPYIVGSPSSAPEVISVAQTQVPSAKLYRIDADGVSVGGSWQPWSADPEAVSGPLQYGNGAGGNLNGCSAFPAGSLDGKVVLVDRGVCAISIKVSNAAAAGARAVIIANNASQAPGDLPPDFSYGGGNPSVAGYSITRTDGLLLRTKLGKTASIDPASAASLAGNMVASSSRGPTHSGVNLKPDIGAPGASVSAEYGTGTGQTAFGGTSGAAPMVAGAAALLIDAYPSRTPAEIKAVLMNTAETQIGINPVALPGYPAPISRIGGGEVRVNRALASKTAAWDADAPSAGLSFGYQALTGSAAFQKKVAVRNYSNKSRTYTITPQFRYADDAASGGVAVSTPATITVPANGVRTFNVKLKTDVTKLPVWTLDAGFFGGDGYRLQSVEFDGYIQVADATDTVRVPWHILPHRAAEVTPTSDHVALSGGSGSLTLKHTGGALDGRVEVFSLLDTSGRIPKPLLPGPGDNFAVTDLKSVGVRMVPISATQFGLQFAVSTFGTRSHAVYPAAFEAAIDSNRDGSTDYWVFTSEFGSFASSGQCAIWVQSAALGTVTPVFFADADLNSGNMIMTVPLAAIGLTPATQFDFVLYAADNYFTGLITDITGTLTYTPNAPRYLAGSDALTVPVGGSALLPIAAVPGGDSASPSQSGVLLLYRDGRTQRESDAISVSP